MCSLGEPIITIYLLNRYVCLESIRSFNLKKGTFLKDLRDGLLLLVAFILVAVIFQFTVNRWIRSEPPSSEVMDLMAELSRKILAPGHCPLPL